MKNNKYKYYKVLQLCSVYGYEDLEFLETDSTYFLNKEQRKELQFLKDNYILCNMSNLRVIKRRELQNENN